MPDSSDPRGRWEPPLLRVLDGPGGPLYDVVFQCFVGVELYKRRPLSAWHEELMEGFVFFFFFWLLFLHIYYFEDSPCSQSW